MEHGPFFNRLTAVEMKGVRSDLDLSVARLVEQMAQPQADVRMPVKLGLELIVFLPITQNFRERGLDLESVVEDLGRKNPPPGAKGPAGFEQDFRRVGGVFEHPAKKGPVERPIGKREMGGVRRFQLKARGQFGKLAEVLLREADLVGGEINPGEAEPGPAAEEDFRLAPVAAANFQEMANAGEIESRVNFLLVQMGLFAQALQFFRRISVEIFFRHDPGRIGRRAEMKSREGDSPGGAEWAILSGEEMMIQQAPVQKPRGKVREAKAPARAESGPKPLPPPPAPRAKPLSALKIPADVNEAEIEADGRSVPLTNLEKPFWPELGLTKRDLLQYYATISPVLLPHLRDRAMVMKRYPNGAAGEFFFQKRAPSPRPDWVDICSIEHASGSVIDFPIVRDLSSLLWVVNLGCIDLNPWYGRCDDANRPDYLHFDLDPVEGADFGDVLQAALAVHQALDALHIPNLPKTTGSRGIHVYAPIERGPTQKQVWTFAKRLAQSLETLHPELLTAEYRKANRPKGRVLVDYNQNAWGRTLSSVYSVRPKPRATVSAPVTWDEVQDGIRIEDFRMENMPARVQKLGDLWRPLLLNRARFKLETLLED